MPSSFSFSLVASVYRYMPMFHSGERFSTSSCSFSLAFGTHDCSSLDPLHFRLLLAPSISTASWRSRASGTSKLLSSSHFGSLFTCLCRTLLSLPSGFCPFERMELGFLLGFSTSYKFNTLFPNLRTGSSLPICCIRLIFNHENLLCVIFFHPNSYNYFSRFI